MSLLPGPEVPPVRMSKAVCLLCGTGVTAGAVAGAVAGLVACLQGYLPTANGIKVEHEEYEGSIEFRWDGEIPYWSGRKKIVKDNRVDQTPAAPPVHSNAVSNQSFLARTSGSAPVELHNEHSLLHLRKGCFPCCIAHQNGDRDEKPDGICSQCARQARFFLYEVDSKLSTSG